MMEKTDPISRWILLRYAEKTDPEQTLRFLNSVKSLINGVTPDVEKYNHNTSTLHVIPDGRYQAQVRTEQYATHNACGLKVIITMSLTHVDGWTMDPEGGLSLMAPNAVRQKHMEMTREGNLRLSDVIQAKGLPDCEIKEMGSVGDHAIYIPRMRQNLSWNQSAYMAHGVAHKKAA